MDCLPGSYTSLNGMDKCALCTGGTYQRHAAATACLLCKPGYYCPQGASAPLPCPEGSYSNRTNLVSASQCVPTDEGFFASTGSTKQLPCPSGTITKSAGLGACVPCDGGTYQDDTGATSCRPCVAGSYCPPGAAADLPCAEGTFSSATNLTRKDQCTTTSPGFFVTQGGTEPQPCAEGTFGASYGLGQCSPCPAGEYQTDKGATACKPCPVGSYCPQGASHPLGCETAGFPNAQTSVPMASSPEDCVCSPEFYNAGANDDVLSCRVCPSGTNCSIAGLTMASLPVKRGYYRPHPDSDDVRRCPDAALNCSNSPVCLESTSGCRGTVNHSLALLGHVQRRLDDAVTVSSIGCYDDLMGPLCLLCAPHLEGKPVYYSRATGSHKGSQRAQCRECRDSARDSILLFFAFVALALLVLLLAWIWYVACMSDYQKKQLHYAWKAFTPHNKLKVLIGAQRTLYPSRLCACRPTSYLLTPPPPTQAST